MYKLFIIFVEHLKLLLNPVIVNAFIFYDGRGKVCHKNWGDDLNYYFLREIVKQPLILLNRTSLAFRLNFRNYLVIGSTIDMLCRPNTEVWGAGIISGNSSLKENPSKVYAVRGPLTRQRLLKEGIECPEIYGDPALLIPCYYQPRATKKYQYGFVAHVSNIEMLKDVKIDGVNLYNYPDILVIDLSNYRHWHDIIDQICSCQAILSSSLHGLIIAEAYHIPNVWIEFGNPLIGGHFKFHDFFLSIHQDRVAPLSIVNNALSTQVVNDEIRKWKQGTIDLQPLLRACPFAIRLPKLEG